MPITIDLNEVAQESKDSTEKEIKQAVGTIVNAVKDAAEDSSRPTRATLHLVSQLADIVDSVVAGTYTGAGLDGLVKREPLMLTGSSSNGTSPTASATDEETQAKLEAISGLFGKSVPETVQILLNLLASLSGLDPRSANQVLHNMGRVGSGELEINKRSNVLMVEEERDNLVRQLATANAERDKARTEAAEATTKLVNAEQELADIKSNGADATLQKEIDDLRVQLAAGEDSFVETLKPALSRTVTGQLKLIKANVKDAGLAKKLEDAAADNKKKP